MQRRKEIKVIIRNRLQVFALGFLLTIVLCSPVFAGEETLSDGKVLMKALADELARSMQLQMEDLEKPYFIQYSADDILSYQISAQYGAIVSSSFNRMRPFYNEVRVGSFELDNTNFSGDSGGFGMFFGGRRGGGFMGRASLPLDDDYTAIRQAIWWATDSNYKSAVETLTRKKAYLKEVNLEDRPHDFSEVKPAEYAGPSAKLEFDKAVWEESLRQISAHFNSYPHIQDSRVQLSVTARNRYVVNSEGTRVRTGSTGTRLSITADVQGKDGMRLSDTITYTVDDPSALPPVLQIIKDSSKLAKNLIEVVKAPILEEYTGPVLFDGKASAELFQRMLSRGLAGSAEPVGSQRSRFRGTENLEKKLGQRILPKSFRVYDDPKVKKVGDTSLSGHYLYDDEGVQAQRVDLIEKGVLKNMLLSRVPTKKLSGSNGHGRLGVGFGGVSASIGSLFVEAEDGKTEKELKAALIEAASDEGLEYGIRVVSMRASSFMPGGRGMRSFLRGRRRGGEGQTLGDPILIYKVFVKNGREELVRGCEFVPIKVRELRDILEAGKTPAVYNSASSGSSVVSPAVIFEEMELIKIEQENPKLPVLDNPLIR